MSEPPPQELFIIGSGRSGTTMVLNSIAALPSVTAVPRLAGTIPRLTLLSALGCRYGVGPQSLLKPSIESRALFAEAGLTPGFQTSVGDSVGPQHAASLNMAQLSRRLRILRRWSGATTVTLKNTTSCARVPILAETFPTARFVHVVRKPWPVIASLLNTSFWPEMTLWWDGRTTAQYGRDEGLPQECVAARHWMRQVSTAVRDLGELDTERRLTIKYEDFISDPAAELQRLIHWGIGHGTATMTADLARQLNIRSQEKELSAYSNEIRSAVDSECSGFTALLDGVL